MAASLPAKPLEKGLQAGNLSGDASLGEPLLQQVTQKTTQDTLVNRLEACISRLPLQKREKLTEIDLVRSHRAGRVAALVRERPEKPVNMGVHG
jgi:hypothetical protein